MTKPIKFRAWVRDFCVADENAMKMVIDNIVLVTPEVWESQSLSKDPLQTWVYNPLTHGTGIYYIRTDYELLMQFTGYHDVNQKEIFVGDIIRGKFKLNGPEIISVAPVENPAGSFGVSLYDYSIGAFAFINLNDLPSNNNSLSFEIIGNIFQCPLIIKDDLNAPNAAPEIVAAKQNKMIEAYERYRKIKLEYLCPDTQGKVDPRLVEEIRMSACSDNADALARYWKKFRNCPDDDITEEKENKL